MSTPQQDLEDETWTDDSEPAEAPAEPRLIELRKHRHLASMQTKVLYGIGLVLLVTLLTLVLGVGFGAFSEGFGLELLRTMLTPTLAAGATIVGTLFALERGKEE
ncbi:hypothetical protein [Saccharopolyspora taberi]|uniref:Uncharacterized protein n=1 Tax=Saccharopolyspora taberi TaxID=60895 RepID=A0ABN3VP95_9PSEU